MEGALKRFFNSHMSVVRSSTTRPNVGYEVRKEPGPLEERLVSVLLSAAGAATSKSIVFSRGREQPRKIAALLRRHAFAAVHYHRHLDAESQDAAHDSWASGDANIMVATGAFGCGVDLSGICVVVHIDEPYSMIDLVQKSGRGGRNGSPSKHIVLLSTFWRARPETCTELAEYLGGSKCRRWVLQNYVDSHSLDCFSSGSERCNVCESMAARVRSGACATLRLESAPWHDSNSRSNNVVNLFSGTGVDSPGEPEDQESSSMKVRTGNALFFGSASGTQRRHADQSLVWLDLVQYLKGNKDKCILCTIS